MNGQRAVFCKPCLFGATHSFTRVSFFRYAFSSRGPVTSAFHDPWLLYNHETTRSQCLTIQLRLTTFVLRSNPGGLEPQRWRVWQRSSAKRLLPFPWLQVTWDREDALFDRARHGEQDEVVMGTRHELVIQSVGRDDFGRYSCKAINSLGSMTRHMSITGKDPPSSGRCKHTPQTAEKAGDVAQGRSWSMPIWRVNTC